MRNIVPKCSWQACWGKSGPPHFYTSIHLCFPYNCTPIHLYAPICLWFPTSGHPHTSPHPPYIWMLPIHLYILPYICTPWYICMPLIHLYDPIHPPNMCMIPHICTSAIHLYAPHTYVHPPKSFYPLYICMSSYIPICLYDPHICTPHMSLHLPIHLYAPHTSVHPIHLYMYKI